MIRPRYLLLLVLTLPLAGCFSDQQKQLYSCDANATRTGPGQPMKAIQACMDQAGYRFTGWDDADANGNLAPCDMAAVVRGMPSGDGKDAMCFEPKGWLALKIYKIEVPVKDAKS